MPIKKSQLLFLLLLLSNLFLVAQTHSLPRSIPEKEGVSSESILRFLDEIAKTEHEMHSIMILRHGKVIAEGWWDPYKPELKHTMYSVSKTFTSTAVGLAAAEKRLTLTDKVISFFPNDVPDTISPYLADLEVRHLLSMTVGQDPDPTFRVASQDTNWVKGFLSTPILYNPGSKFLYNSLATYMLSAIVQKATGEKVIDFLQPRLFEPLGIAGADWETDPKGINVGGWGLRVQTEHMAKLGLLYLQKGKWNGKQVLPRQWVDEATTKKIEQAPGLSQAARDSSDWTQGYCYQIWRSRHNSYRGDGAYGQYILVLPEKDVVIAITSETKNMQDELNYVWKYLLPGIKTKALPANASRKKLLQQRLAGLAITRPSYKTPGIPPDINHKKFALDSNDRGLKSIQFDTADSVCTLSFDTDSTNYMLRFGKEQWIPGETDRRGPYLVARAKNNRAELPPYKVTGSYGWKDDKTLELYLRYTESPHSEKILCSFEGNYLTMQIKSSIEVTQNQKEIKGHLVE